METVMRRCDMGGDFGWGAAPGRGEEDAFTPRPWARGEMGRWMGPWVLFDGECVLCRRGAARFGPLLRRRGFRLEALQSEVGRHFAEGKVEEMKVVTREGRVIGGAEGVAYVCGFVWWARPVAWVWRVPGMRGVMERVYRWVARHRHCDGGACGIG